MGDKYETSREMLQQDINRLEKQLSDNNKMLFQLRQCALKQTKLVEVGSLVKTNLGIFFLLVSLGEVYFNMQKVMVISAISPLGKQLLQKKINDSFLLNNMKYEILDFS
jgi:transcription elongation GreA/GreB family factor